MSVSLQTLGARPQAPLAQAPFHQWTFPDGTEWTLFYRLDVTVMARPDDHVIAWTVRHPASGRRFSHSTWQGDLLERERLARSHSEHVPQVSRTAHARGVVLGYCDGQRSVAQVQETVLRDHPALFPSREEIARFVNMVLSRDTQ